MYWPAINSVILLCICVVIFLAVSQILKRLADNKTSFTLLQTQLEEINDKLSSHENISNRQQLQISELNKNLTVCFSPLESLESRIEEVSSTVQLLQSNMDSESTEQKLYGRAKKMIEMGADIEELVIECEIPRAEAELLLSIYKK